MINCGPLFVVVSVLGRKREGKEEVGCHPKADVEIACRLDAQILLLAHVEGPVKASPHQKE